MARKRIEPNPHNATLQELKDLSRVGSNETALRCTALQFLLAGVLREQVCTSLLISESAIRKWIKLFNEKGIDGLIAKKRPGRTVIIGEEQAGKLTELIEKPGKAGRDIWTAKSFHGYISKEFQIECSYKTVVRFFHKQGFALKVPRPWSDRQDEKKREEYLKNLQVLAKDTNVEIWFEDESGFDGDPRPRQRWERKGAKTRVTKNGAHIRMNVMGMVCPRTGEFFALEVSNSDTEIFQAFLNEANKNIESERKRNIIILDNASWHKSKKLKWGKFEPMYLPPYSPDLNPIERLWLVTKAKWFNNYLCHSVDQLIDRLDIALLDLIDNPEKVQKTASIATLI